MTRIVKIALIALVALLAVALVALLIPYDSPELGRALLARVNSEDLRLEATGFRLHLLSGLTLSDVEVESRLEGGTRVTASAGQVVFEHRLAPLLSGRVSVEEIRFESPVVELSSSATPSSDVAPAAPAAAAPAANESAAEATATGEGSGLAIEIDRFVIVDGNFVDRSAADGSTTEIEGLDLELRAISLEPGAGSALERVVAEGNLTAEVVRTASIEARGVDGEVSLGDGHLVVSGLDLPTELGRFAIDSLDVDLGRDPYGFALAFSGDPIRTHQLLGAEGGFAPARLVLETSGAAGAIRSYNGKGRISVDQGLIGNAPALVKLQELLGQTPILDAAYDAFDIQFEIVGGRLEIEPFSIRTAAGLDMSFSGTVDLLGPLGLRSLLKAPREAIDMPKEIPKEIVETLIDSEGNVNLAMLIEGTSNLPKVDFDRETWKKAVGKRVEDELKKELGKKLGDLFGRKDDR